MTLKELEKFIDDCFHRNVQIPENLVFEISDWSKSVPEDYKYLKQIDYNYKPTDDDYVRVQIKPLKDENTPDLKSGISLNLFSKEVYKQNKEKGFYDDYEQILSLVPDSKKFTVTQVFMAQRIALLHSEVSEMLESIRQNKRKVPNLIDVSLTTPDKQEFKQAYEINVKGTLEEEVADYFIRGFDLVGFTGIDIEKHIELKLRYNSCRPYKHGKNS